MGSFIETLSSLKKGTRAQKVCPRCGSTNVTKSGPFDGWLFPIRYVCRDCDYSGTLVLEVEREP